MKNKIVSKITLVVLLGTTLSYSAPVFALTKEETVYSKLDANGKEYSTIVNNHLINEQQEKLINDLSDLINIKNVNGDEELEQDGNKLIWKAEGNDIYYQGETQKELPIECKISYKLDGKEIEPKKLAGRSGKVEITIEYTNKEKHGDLYTPFVTVCGTIIDNKNNRNIKITNGKVVDDGSKTIVMGIAFPGLQESLGISKEKLDVPSSVKITMDATDFELNNIITYVTPKVIEESDLKIFDELDEIYNKVNVLQSSSKKLEKGANQLNKGVSTYTKGTQEFSVGVKNLQQGATKINTEYKKLDDGINQLAEGSNELNDGAEKLSSGAQALEAGVGTISSTMEALRVGSEVVAEGTKELQTGVGTIQTQVDAMCKKDNTKTITQLNTLIRTNNSSITAIQTQIAAAMGQLGMQAPTTAQGWTNLIENADNQPEPLKSNLNLIKVLQGNNLALNQTLTTLNESQNSLEKLNDGLKLVKAGLDGDGTVKNPGLVNGTKAIESGISELKTKGIDGTLKSASSQLAEGSSSLYNGSKQLKEGAIEAKKGSKEAKDGLATLQDGTTKLLDANNQLNKGASEISKGTKELSNGMTKFNKEGIENICSYINGNVKDITTRLEKLQELANEYNHFTMLNGDDNGSVKFIMIMDEIKKEEDNKQEAILQNNEQNNQEKQDNDSKSN